jgi:hypothetical protein
MIALVCQTRSSVRRTYGRHQTPKTWSQNGLLSLVAMNKRCYVEQDRDTLPYLVSYLHDLMCPMFCNE